MSVSNSTHFNTLLFFDLFQQLLRRLTAHLWAVFLKLCLGRVLRHDVALILSLFSAHAHDNVIMQFPHKMEPGVHMPVPAPLALFLTMLTAP